MFNSVSYYMIAVCVSLTVKGILYAVMCYYDNCSIRCAVVLIIEEQFLSNFSNFRNSITSWIWFENPFELETAILNNVANAVLTYL